MPTSYPMPTNRPTFKNLTGRRFGRIRVLSYAGQSRWNCSCACGAKLIIHTSSFWGCRKKRCMKCRLSRKPGYSSWQGMKDRCYNRNDADFHRYGGRGIKICARWKNSFENFFADMGPRPSLKHSLDRFPDRDGDYRPGNCRWATPTEQARNRDSNHPLTFQGTTMCLTAWARKRNMNQTTLSQRILAGWPIRKALLTPVRSRIRK